jgi:hypothetical protein
MVLKFLKKDELAQIESKSSLITALNDEKRDLQTRIETCLKELEGYQKAQEEIKKNSGVIDTLEKNNHKLERELQESKKRISDLELRLQDHKTELENMVSKSKLDQVSSLLAQSQEDREEVVRDRQRLWEEYQKLAASRDALQASFNEIKEAKNEEHTPDERSELEQALYDERFLIHQMDHEIADHKRENALLQIQIQQSQEELITYQRKMQTMQEESSALNARWSRLERRMPNYIDFGGLEVVQVDTIGVTPQILWRVSDFFQAGLLLPQFYFRTTSHDGMAGIGLVNDLSSIETASVFIPGSIASSSDQVELFRSYTTTEWHKINSALLVLEQLISNKGIGLGVAIEGFDFSFWKQSLSSLISDIRRLPQLLRFERVKLKREIQNPDYEHLWLEFYDLEFGNYRKSKLEFRLGAAMIQPGSFSRFPKLEFPLVDGVHKPFESWFAESYDDHGGKFELRFSLDKQAFDVMNWLKLTTDDRLLLQSFILALPSSIASLVNDGVAIRRPWAQWSDFVRETTQLFRLQLQAIAAKLNTQTNESPISQAPQTQQSVATASKDKKKSISVAVVKSAKEVKITNRNAAGKQGSKRTSKS